MVQPPRVYDWKLRPRPYNNKDAAKAYSKVIDAKTADWHYNKHQKGYVDALNKIEKGISAIPSAKRKGNGNYSEYGELKRRLPWNHSGALLHDVYWNSFGRMPDEATTRDPKSTLNKQIVKDFGSYENWKKDFIQTALSTKLSGWAVLVYDSLYSGRLLNVLVDEHQNGAIWGGIPIISLDMFEHAYYHSDGPDRRKYIDAFIKNLNWPRVEDYFDQVVQPIRQVEAYNYFDM